jgi:hypothetical protein
MLFPDFLHVIDGVQGPSACFVGNGSIGNQAGVEGLLPDLNLARQVLTDLSIAIEKRVRHELPPIKSPVSYAADGAF